MEQHHAEDLVEMNICGSNVARQVDARFKKIMSALTEMNRNETNPNDCDSVRTEEIEKDFKKTLILTDDVKGNFMDKKERKLGTRPILSGSCSDLDSVNTEDYEYQFQEVMVKQVENDPVKKFDQFLIDSDLDTVKSQAVGDKFQLALGLSMENCGESKHKFESFVLPLSDRATLRRQPLQKQIQGGQSRFGRDVSPVSDLELNEEEKALAKTSAKIRSELEAEGFGSWQKRGRMIQNRPILHKCLPDGSMKTKFSEKSDQGKLAIVNKVDLEISVKLQKELSKLQSEIKDSMRVKQMLSLSVGRLETMFRLHQQEVRSMEKQLKDYRMMSEDVRTELKLVEFKRDSAFMELRNVNSELENKRLVIQNLATQETEWIDLLNREECEKLYKEEWSKEKEILESKIQALENKCKAVEQKKDDFIQEKNQEYDDIKHEIENQLQHSKDQSIREIGDLKRKIQEASEENRVMQSNLNRSRQQNTQLTEQISCLQRELAVLRQHQDAINDESIKSLNITISEQELELNNLKSQLDLEIHSRERQLNEATKEKEQLETAWLERMTSIEADLLSKDKEIVALREKIRQQSDWLKQMTDNLTEETYNKFHVLMNEEKVRWEVEKEDELSGQMETMKDEMIRTVTQLREELEHEKNLTHTYSQQIQNMKEQIDEMEQANRMAYNQQKLQDEISNSESQLKKRQMKESIKKLQQTIELYKKQIEDLTMKNKELKMCEQETVAAIKEKESKHLNELNLQCQRLSEMLSQGSPSLAVRDHGFHVKENLVCEDIPSAMSASLANLRNIVEELRKKLIQEQEERSENVRNQLTALRNQMKMEINSEQTRMQEEKRQAQETLKDRLVKEHLEEMDKLQRSLSGNSKGLYNMLATKDSELCEIQQNMGAWKEHIATKLAQKFTLELNKELEKHLKKCKVVSAGEKVICQARTDGTRSNVQMLLQASDPPSHKKKQEISVKPSLNLKNCDLVSRAQSGSVPNLVPILEESKDGNEVFIRQLQLQVQRLENSCKVAEERANSNEHLLSQKLVEMSKLQGLVTRQTKELMQLRRADSQLQNKN